MSKFKFEEKVKQGYYLADYFNKTTTILTANKPDQMVTIQWFQREEETILCGIEQTLALLKYACPHYSDLKIWAIAEGTMIKPLEPVLKIEGRYQDFGWLEGMIDGILARNSSIATNFYRINQAAQDKAVFNMNDRADLYVNQEFDGYAAYIGGCRSFATPAAVELIDDPLVPKPSGTMPHALIQAFGGDVLKATIAFHKQFPTNQLVSLIDYHNDCVTDALKVADYFGDQLFAVRLDTSEGLIDETLQKNKAQYPKGANLNGVNKYLVWAVRQALDQAGHQAVKIIVSSGFNAKKIAEFEQEKVPVDVYGVGSAIAKVKIGFTGDAVLIEGQPQAKVGRQNLESKRLKKVQ
jgi:nicotinate phosphoribosyltransferase